MANGKKMAGDMLAIVLALVIGAVLIGNLLPVGINAVNDANTTSWGSTEVQIYNLLPLFFVLVPLAVVAGWAMDAF